MKKISLLSLAFLVGIGLTGCSSDDYDDWTDQKPSEPENVVTIDGLTAHSTGTIDLNRAGGTVAPCILPVENIPEGYSFASIDLKLTPDEGAVSTDPVTLSLDGNCMVDSATLQKAVVASYGAAPTVRHFKGDVYPILTNGTNNVRISAGKVDVYVTPAYQSYDIYTIVGAMNGWTSSVSNQYALYPTSKEGVYTYTTQWTGDANLKLWLIDDGNNGSWDKAWGTAVDGDNSASGSLVLNQGSFKCPEAGAYYTITIDMNNHTYTWTKLDNQNPTTYNTMGIIGSSLGWSDDVNMVQTSPHNWYVSGVTIKAGGFKIRANDGWDDAWGVGDSNSGYFEKTYGSLTYTGVGVNVPGTGNPNLPADGTYNIYFNDITGQFLFVPVLK